MSATKEAADDLRAAFRRAEELLAKRAGSLEQAVHWLIPNSAPGGLGSPPQDALVWGPRPAEWAGVTEPWCLYVDAPQGGGVFHWTKLNDAALLKYALRVPALVKAALQDDRRRAETFAAAAEALQEALSEIERAYTAPAPDDPNDTLRFLDLE